MTRNLHDLPGGEEPLRAALWTFLRPMLSPRLAEFHRDAFLIDDAERSTVDLAVHGGDCSLDDLDLDEETIDTAASPTPDDDPLLASGSSEPPSAFLGATRCPTWRRTASVEEREVRSSSKGSSFDATSTFTAGSLSCSIAWRLLRKRLSVRRD